MITRQDIEQQKRIMENKIHRAVATCEANLQGAALVETASAHIFDKDDGREIIVRSSIRVKNQLG